ncbi:hypothetical protein [Candidatus Amarobacter glycogenicus]|uniref:hypothetical protein n=1 Tax=Candidatus Amarobacter glycogenicus TaxID=3140699 RepID=UPI00313668B2|nr:hypothetical protein [Dehalococcoidia bacterium]
MPEIEHRRHSWREPPGEHLTQKGVDLARRVGGTSMGRFDLVVTSDMPRAFETAIAMGYAVDRQEPVLGYAAPSWEDEVDWTLGCAEFARGFALGGATTRACRPRQTSFAESPRSCRQTAVLSWSRTAGSSRQALPDCFLATTTRIGAFRANVAKVS